MDDTSLDFHHGCYLDAVDTFDYAVFGMTPRQAMLTDPHHRMALRAMYLAFEDAGYSADRLRGSRTGVFVGFATNPGSTYMDYLARIEPSAGQQAITGNIPAMLANRLSHLLDLRGPSLVVDTACSATLVALHQAKNALLAGDCDMAVVGGARIVFAPVKHPHTNIGIESSDGVTRTFDEAADGTGFGEGPARWSSSAPNRRWPTATRSTPSSGAARSTTTATPTASPARAPRRRRGCCSPRGATPGSTRARSATSRRTARPPGSATRSSTRASTSRRSPGHLGPGLLRRGDGQGERRVTSSRASGVIGLLKAVAVLRHRMLPPQANFGEPCNPKLDFTLRPLFVPTGPTTVGVPSTGHAAAG